MITALVVSNAVLAILFVCDFVVYCITLAKNKNRYILGRVEAKMDIIDILSDELDGETFDKVVDKIEEKL